MVYVVDKDGHYLSPMTRHGKVRIMLNEGRAKVFKNDPFTIQLTRTADRTLEPNFPNFKSD